jgi:hypothetical protein
VKAFTIQPSGVYDHLADYASMKTLAFIFYIGPAHILDALFS